MEFIGKMVDTAVKQFGNLDIVIANSGITLFGDFLDYPPEFFYRVMNVNLGGSFFLAQSGSKADDTAHRAGQFYLHLQLPATRRIKSLLLTV